MIEKLLFTRIGKKLITKQFSGLKYNIVGYTYFNDDKNYIRKKINDYENITFEDMLSNTKVLLKNIKYNDKCLPKNSDDINAYNNITKSENISDYLIPVINDNTTIDLSVFDIDNVDSIRIDGLIYIIKGYLDEKGNVYQYDDTQSNILLSIAYFDEDCGVDLSLNNSEYYEIQVKIKSTIEIVNQAFQNYEEEYRRANTFVTDDGLEKIKRYKIDGNSISKDVISKYKKNLITYNRLLSYQNTTSRKYKTGSEYVQYYKLMAKHTPLMLHTNKEGIMGHTSPNSLNYGDEDWIKYDLGNTISNSQIYFYNSKSNSKMEIGLGTASQTTSPTNAFNLNNYYYNTSSNRTFRDFYFMCNSKNTWLSNDVTGEKHIYSKNITISNNKPIIKTMFSKDSKIICNDKTNIDNIYVNMFNCDSVNYESNDTSNVSDRPNLTTIINSKNVNVKNNALSIVTILGARNSKIINNNNNSKRNITVIGGTNNELTLPNNGDVLGSNITMIGNYLKFTGNNNNNPLTIIGEWNKESNNNSFIVGSGSSNSERRNVLEVTTDGIIKFCGSTSDNFGGVGPNGVYYNDTTTPILNKDDFNGTEIFDVIKYIDGKYETYKKLLDENKNASTDSNKMTYDRRKILCVSEASFAYDSFNFYQGWPQHGYITIDTLFDLAYNNDSHSLDAEFTNPDDDTININDLLVLVPYKTDNSHQTSWFTEVTGLYYTIDCNVEAPPTYSRSTGAYKNNNGNGSYTGYTFIYGPQNRWYICNESSKNEGIGRFYKKSDGTYEYGRTN